MSPGTSTACKASSLSNREPFTPLPLHPCLILDHPHSPATWPLRSVLDLCSILSSHVCFFPPLPVIVLKLTLTNLSYQFELSSTTVGHAGNNIKE